MREVLGEARPTDFEPIVSQIKVLSDKISAIPPPIVNIPAQDKVDLSPLNSSVRMGLENVLRKVRLIPAAPNYSVELSEIKGTFSKLSETIKLQENSLAELSLLKDLMMKVLDIFEKEGMKHKQEVVVSVDTPKLRREQREPRPRFKFEQ